MIPLPKESNFDMLWRRYMKKEIFLSFKPNFFRPILYDMKKYEYRKRFCMEPTTAFLYLTAPLCQVIGIIEFGVPIKTKEIIEKYPHESAIYKRIQHCIDVRELFAIPIESLQLYKEPISISTIKQLDPSFHVPRDYLVISNYKIIHDYLKKQEMYDIEFYNTHDIIYECNLGMTCKEMELTPEFAQKDFIYTNTAKYNTIKCGYLNGKFNRRVNEK